MTPLPHAVTLAGFGAPIDGTELLLMEPNAVLSKPQAHRVRGARVDATSGAGFVDKATHQLPNTRHEFEFVCETREQYTALRQFFDRMQGRKTAFWFPTWQWELEVIGTANSMATVQAFRTSARFGARYFWESPSYRMWALLCRDAAELYVASDVNPVPADGYEFVTIGARQLVNGGLPEGLSLAESSGVRPLWLRYGRFDTDTFDAEVSIDGKGAAVVTLAMVEVFDLPTALVLEPAVMEWFVADAIVPAPTEYAVHIFKETHDGDATFDPFEITEGEGDVEYWFVAGSAQGGVAGVNNAGGTGGGAAGGFKSGTIPLGPGIHGVKVGKGGFAGSENGKHTVFRPYSNAANDITALGGGTSGTNGGSGGGRGSLDSAPGSGTPGQGNDGGAVSTTWAASGAGGAGSQGVNASGFNAGDGGTGIRLNPFGLWSYAIDTLTLVAALIDAAISSTLPRWCGGGGGGAGCDNTFAHNGFGAGGLGHDGGGHGRGFGGAYNGAPRAGFTFGSGGGGTSRIGAEDTQRGGLGYQGFFVLRYATSTGIVATGGIKVLSSDLPFSIDYPYPAVPAAWP